MKMTPFIPSNSSLSREVARHYRLRDQQAVQAFFDKHPDTVPVLLEASTLIHHYFGESPIYLEVTPDYDALEERLYLLVSVATDLPPADALGRLAYFDEDWWLDQPIREQGTLLFSVE